MKKTRLFLFIALCLCVGVMAAAVKNPLSAVAEFNLRADGSFENSHSVNSAYFKWSDVKNVSLPKGYHIPSKEELTVISGLYPIDQENPSPCPRFSWNIDDSADETVTIFGETLSLSSHYYGESKKVCYAIRFIGGDNKYLSAFRWQPVFSADDTNQTRIDGIRVTCRLLGPDGASIDVKQIANEDYWNSNNSEDVSRFFAAAGYGNYTEDASLMDQNERGRYWSSTPRSADATGAWGFGFDAHFVMVYPWVSSARYCLRCFKDADAPDDPQPPVSIEDNPLSVVAEFNLKADGSFDDAQNVNSAYFKWSDVKSITPPAGYHIPSKEELLVVSGIYPQSGAEPTPYPDLSWNIDKTGDETVTIFGKTLTLGSHYYGSGDYVCYAIRFIGGDNKYLSAYKWEPVFSADDTNQTKIDGLRITCRLLGPDGASVDVKQIANEDYWNSNTTADVVRFFPAAGFGNYTADGTVMEQNLRGRYWSITPKNEQETGAWGFGFDSDFVMVYSWISSAQYCLRCFKDTPSSADDPNISLTLSGSDLPLALSLVGPASADVDFGDGNRKKIDLVASQGAIAGNAIGSQVNVYAEDISKFNAPNQSISKLSLLNNVNSFAVNVADNVITDLDIDSNSALVSIDLRNNKLSAEALNKFFENLHNLNDTDSNQTSPFADMENYGKIFIVGNPGASVCNGNIAIQKGYTLDIDFSAIDYIDSNKIHILYDLSARSVKVSGVYAGDIIRIFNTSGIIVNQTIAAHSAEYINVAALNPGLYIVSCNGATAKFLVK